MYFYLNIEEGNSGEFALGLICSFDGRNKENNRILVGKPLRRQLFKIVMGIAGNCKVIVEEVHFSRWYRVGSEFSSYLFICGLFYNAVSSSD
jgi:hypothetical protein